MPVVPTSTPLNNLRRKKNRQKDHLAIRIVDIENDRWWFLPHGKTKFGPFTLEELKKAYLNETNIDKLAIRKGGDPDWVKWVNAKTVFPSLEDYFDEIKNSKKPLKQKNNAQKVPCKACGTMILPSTSKKTHGKCMPCSKGIRKATDNAQSRTKVIPPMPIIVDIQVVLLPAHPDDKKNGEMIHSAFYAFQRKYPNAVKESPVHKFVGSDAQNITFPVQAMDIEEALQMRVFFNQKLYDAGFRPT